MKTRGSCFCGAIAYEAEIDEQRIGVCHCRDCQIFSGSAFRTAAALSPADFEITKGSPKTFDKTADSGNVRRMVFCGDCGTHICSLPPDPATEGAFVSLRIATCDDFARLKPRGELFCRSKVSWLPAIEGAIAFDAEPPPRR